MPREDELCLTGRQRNRVVVIDSSFLATTMLSEFSDVDVKSTKSLSAHVVR